MGQCKDLIGMNRVVVLAVNEKSGEEICGGCQHRSLSFANVDQVRQTTTLAICRAKDGLRLPECEL